MTQIIELTPADAHQRRRTPQCQGQRETIYQTDDNNPLPRCNRSSSIVIGGKHLCRLHAGKLALQLMLEQSAADCREALPLDQQRAVFEKWHQVEFGNETGDLYNRMPGKQGSYYLTELQHAWLAWRASRLGAVLRYLDQLLVEQTAKPLTNETLEVSPCIASQ